MLPYNGDFMEFLDNIMEFLLSFLYHIVESVWTLEILIQNVDTTMWSFYGVSLPDSGVFFLNRPGGGGAESAHRLVLPSAVLKR